jgi:hypothetical protein
MVRFNVDSMHIEIRDFFGFAAREVVVLIVNNGITYFMTAAIPEAAIPTARTVIWSLIAPLNNNAKIVRNGNTATNQSVVMSSRVRQIIIDVPGKNVFPGFKAKVSTTLNS